MDRGQSFRLNPLRSLVRVVEPTGKPPGGWPIDFATRTICDMSNHRLPQPDRPWVMRTYSGHSNAKKSNELYRKNIAKGQTGLSIAFDLPTQTGYDADDELSKGEVG